MEEKVEHIRQGYQPTAEYLKEGYQPKGEQPAQLNPPKVGSAAVKPGQPQNGSGSGGEI